MLFSSISHNNYHSDYLILKTTLLLGAFRYIYFCYKDYDREARNDITHKESRKDKILWGKWNVNQVQEEMV